MAIPPAFLQELLARTDVAEVVGRHVQLKKAGANFAGLCPFHAEKSPSFTVSPAKQFYHCFGCGKSGNAIGFLMEHLNMGFIDAVKDLAQQTGLQVPEDDASPQDRARALQEREQRATLTDVLEKAADAYQKQLKSAPRAIDYLKGRGLSGEIAKTFGLGYSPEGWRTLAGVFPNYDDPLLAESGLVILNEEDADNAKRYDRFRGRIMFPIRNVKGECIGFGGRVLTDEKPKYLNSPETPVFSKGRELYGLFEARAALREHGFALVTEGYMDVVALAQLGFANAVATLGTACTPEHVQKLLRFTDAVVFSFDGDAAGQRAAHKALHAALPHASDVRSIKFLFLPAEHDPDSFIRANGPEVFAQQVKQAVPLSRFLLQAAAQDCDLSSAEGRARLASQAKPLWNALPDGALKRQLLGEIAEQVQLDSRELQNLWHLGARSAGRQRPPSTEPPPDDDYTAPQGSYEISSGTRSPNMHLSANWHTKYSPGKRLAGRTEPLSREDRALRLLLTDPAAWMALSNPEHSLLCSLPAPHGELFTWLDSQHLEHGAQPWAALREGLRGHVHEVFVCGQIDRMPPNIENDPAELRAIMRELSLQQLEQETTRLAALAPTDPAAFARYRLLDAQYRQLKAGVKV